MIDLNDQLATANGVAGGKQTVQTAGLNNWYVNRNVRFMFNSLNGDIAKQVSATNVGDVGAILGKIKTIMFARPCNRILVEHRPTGMAQRARPVGL
jgi:phosphate-selective porin